MARNAVFRELGISNFDNGEDYTNGLFGDVFGDIDEEIGNRRPYTLRRHAEIEDWDDIAFFQRFRMKKQTFQRVVDLVAPHMITVQRRSRYLSTQQKVMILLRFLASGSFEQNVGDNVRVSQPTVSHYLPKVCDVLLNYVSTFIRMPQTQVECQAAASAFHSFAGFPRTIGAIDCTHVKILSPGGLQAESFRNRKGFFSLNVQTVSPANLKVLDIVERWPGASHDSTIFSASNLKMHFDSGHFGQYIMVGDSGYSNLPYLATPFTTNHPGLANDPIKRQYQAALIRTRNVVERQYGVLKRRFPVLRHGLNVALPTAQKLIVCAAILHNICIEEGEIDVDAELALPINAEEESRAYAEHIEGETRSLRARKLARDEVLQHFRIEAAQNQRRF